MKRIIALIGAAAAMMPAGAETLTPRQALDRLTTAPKAAKAMGIKAREPRLVMTGTADSGLPAYYVFTNADGTLIVSADDLATPLLGYTDTGEFDPQAMPPQMQWWLGEYSRQIEWAAQYGVSPQPQQLQTLEKLPAIQPQLTAKWNQGAPYNKYCPRKNGELTVTGCVATAMAQVMHYHQWPQTTVAPITYTWNETALTSPATKFDWSNMLDTYDKGYTTAQADAVARLMQLAGYSINMDYGLSSDGGSSASSSDMRPALVDIFGYDVGADYAYRDYYQAAEWTRMIYDNLKDVGPVVYRGEGETGGHAFVCDGYDGLGMFHINWGWGGAYDGYFALSALNPDGLGIGGGSGSYNSYQGAVLGIRPPQAGSVAPEPYVYCAQDPTGYTSLHTIVFGGGYYTASYAKSPFTYGAKMVNASTGEASYFTSNIIDVEFEPGYGYTRYSVVVPNTLADGTYEAYPIYRYNGGEWRMVKIPYYYRQCLTVTVRDGQISLPEVETAEPADKLILKSYHINAGFVPQERYDVTLTVSNTYAETREVSVAAYLGLWATDRWQIYSHLGTTTINVLANSTGELEFDGMLEDIDAGYYYLLFAQDGYVTGYSLVTVTAKGAAGIGAIEADEAPARYYNLNGVEVQPDRLTPGVYIRQSGAKTEKVVIK